MGCSSSKLPAFPPKSAGVIALPSTSKINQSELPQWPGTTFENAIEDDYQDIIVIPVVRAMGGSDVAIYLSKDFVPSYYLRSGIMSTKLVKYYPNNAKPEVLAEIKLKPYVAVSISGSTDLGHLLKYEINTFAQPGPVISGAGSKDILKVATKMNPKEDDGIKIEGYSITGMQRNEKFEIFKRDDGSQYKRKTESAMDEFILHQDGHHSRPIARVYENVAVDSSADMVLSAPMGIHMRSNLTDVDLVKALCITLFASGRFIASQQMGQMRRDLRDRVEGFEKLLIEGKQRRV